MMRIVLIGCLLACAACATGAPYQACALPAEEQARIVVSSDSALAALPGDGATMRITCVDGEPTNESLIIIRFPTEVRVRPGRHNLGVLFNHMNSSASAALWVDAEAGRTYTVHTELRGYDIRFWLTVSATGRPVGGIVGMGTVPEPGGAYVRMSLVAD
jgi:hypothetical protein